MEKDEVLHLNKIESVTQGCPMPRLHGRLWTLLVHEKKKKMREGNVNRRTDGRADDGQQTIKKSPLSFQFRYATNQNQAAQQFIKTN